MVKTLFKPPMQGFCEAPPAAQWVLRQRYSLRTVFEDNPVFRWLQEVHEVRKKGPLKVLVGETSGKS